MCRCWAVLMAVGFAALAGCQSANKEHTTARLHAPPMAGVVGDDVVYLDVAVIERPFGDVYLNRELWNEADEEVMRVEGDPVVSLERKTTLEKNGFRIAQVGGMLPTKLHDLLMSPRSCQARRSQKHAGNETILSCGSTRPHCRCQLAHDERTAILDVDKARCELQVMPSLSDDGRVRLCFTPRLKHGDVKTAFVPVRDADGQLHWERQEHQAEEVYPWLSWTLTLAPHEYVVVGALLDKGETLGEQFFLTQEEDQPVVQRLLVVRAAHVPTPAGSPEETQGRCPPLALRLPVHGTRQQRIKINRQDAKNAKKKKREKIITKKSLPSLLLSWRSWRLGGLFFCAAGTRNRVSIVET